jgi:hypothetical protein
MSETLVPVAPVTPLLPGLFAAIGDAITARLQLAFPPSLFRFKDLPPAFTPEVWRSLTEGNQPMIGLGFVGVKPISDTRVARGVAQFMLLIAKRGERTTRSLWYGDAQGAGVLAYAATAWAVLQGFNACTGPVDVASMNNTVAEAWKDNSAVIALDLRVPVTVQLADAISDPGIGIFETLVAQWNVPTPVGATVIAGSEDTYASEWDNPNV